MVSRIVNSQRVSCRTKLITDTTLKASSIQMFGFYVSGDALTILRFKATVFTTQLTICISHDSGLYLCINV